MRIRLVSLVLMLSAGLMFLPRPGTGQPSANASDPWVGTYLKYTRYDTQRRGQFGEARRITVSRHSGAYRLTDPYNGWIFSEMEEGVLSDGGGGLGRIYLGSTEFADGKRVTILRAEFCYEHFILYRIE